MMLGGVAQLAELRKRVTACRSLGGSTGVSGDECLHVVAGSNPATSFEFNTNTSTEEAK